MSVGRIQECFQRLAAERRKALIPFVTAGDPGTEQTVPILQALVSGGADLLELGVPFSDPMADGPVIQGSSERALKRGVGLRAVLQMVSTFRETDCRTPLVLMGYLNPVERMGHAEFCERAHAAGVDGVLIVDMPLEEAGPLRAELRARQLDCVMLAAPTTSAARLRRIGRQVSGFLYYVTLKGVTGSTRLQVAAVTEALQQVRACIGALPLAVGFGIKNAAGVAALAPLGDAVVVGSALVDNLAAAARRGESPAQSAEDFARTMRAALDSASRNQES